MLLDLFGVPQQHLGAPFEVFCALGESGGELF
jgi:hypothetical protein